MSRPKKKFERKRANEPDDIELHLAWGQIDPNTPLGKLTFNREMNPRLSAFVWLLNRKVEGQSGGGVIMPTLMRERLDALTVGAVYDFIGKTLKLKRKSQLSPQMERDKIKTASETLPKRKTRASDRIRDNAIKYAQKLIHEGKKKEYAYLAAAELHGLTAAAVKKAIQRRAKPKNP